MCDWNLCGDSQRSVHTNALILMHPENSSHGWCRFQASEPGVDQCQESGRCSLTFCSQCFTPRPVAPLLQCPSVVLVWSDLTFFHPPVEDLISHSLSCWPAAPPRPLSPLQPLPHLPSLSEPTAVPWACRSGGDLIKAGGGSLANGPSQ